MMNMKVSPEKIYLPYSKENQTENQLDIKLTIPGKEKIQPDYIKLSIPLGAGSQAFCSNTDVNGITLVLHGGDEWSVSPIVVTGGNAYWILQTNENVSDKPFLFQMCNIISNTQLGMTQLEAVLYWTDETTEGPVYLPLTKEQPPLQILEFNVRPSNVNAGEQVELAWNVQGCDKVDILPLGTELSPHKRELHTVIQEERIRLSAKNRTGDTVQDEITIGLNTPEILSFVCEQGAAAKYEDMITLSWELRNSSYARLLPVGKEYYGTKMSATLSLTDNTEYILECPKNGGVISKSIKVSVSNLKIAEFTVTPQKVKKGGNFTIHWKTFGADRILLYTENYDNLTPLAQSEGTIQLNSFSDVSWLDYVDAGKSKFSYKLKITNISGEEDIRACPVEILLD